MCHRALSEEQIEILADKYIIGLYQQMEDEVIADIARRVKATGRYTETAELMAKDMIEQGYSADKIRTAVMQSIRADKDYQMAVAENTLKAKQEIQDIIDKTVAKAKVQGKELIAQAGSMAWNNDLSMWEEQGEDLKQPNSMSQLIKAAQKQTVGELKNLTRSMGFKNVLLGTTGVKGMYQREMDLALLKVCTGTFSYDAAVDECIHRMAQSGLRTIDYASGKSYQLDTAARMCVRTGMSQLSGKITEANLQQSDHDLVITSQHMGSRPEHAVWQNKVFSYSGKSKKYPDFVKETGYGTVTGLKGANCTHDFYPYWEGASVVPDNVTVPEPKVIDGKKYTYYQMTQQQRKMERQIRATKREIEAQNIVGGDVTVLKNKLSRQMDQYVSFSDKAELRPKENRLRIIAGTSAMPHKTKFQKAVDLIFRDKPFSNMSEKERFEDTMAVTQAYKQLPLSVKTKMSDVTFEMGYDASACDIENRIIHVGKGTEVPHIYHEYGHLIENYMMKKDDVDAYKNYLTEGLTSENIVKKIYYDNLGNEVPVFLVTGERFESEYQGRLYVRSMHEAVNQDGTININVLGEVVSEVFRKYMSHETISENALALMKEAIK